GRSVNAVATGSPADRYDQVSRSRLLARAINGNQADGAAEHERIAQVALLETDRAVDGGNANAVAVVAHPGDDTFHHLDRMQHAGRQRLHRRVRRREAEYVGVADRFRPKA